MSESPYAARPWFEHYDYWVPRHMPYPARPLTEILDTAAIDGPDRTATAFFGATLTFQQIKARADRLAIALSGLGPGGPGGPGGITKGDRVGIMLPNCPQYIIAAFAVLRLGAVVVNINPSYTARELLTVAADSGVRVLITLDALAPLALSLTPPTALEHIIVTSLAEYTPAAAPPPRVEGTLSLAELIDATSARPASASQAIHVPIAADDLAVLQYTGGTTGTPKGAMLTHANIFANVIQSQAFMDPARDAARYLLVIPYFHIYAFTVGMMTGLWVGALQILIPKYDVEQVLNAIPRLSSHVFSRRADGVRVAPESPARRGIRPRQGAHVQQRRRAVPGRRDRSVDAHVRPDAERGLRAVGNVAGHAFDAAPRPEETGHDRRALAGHRHVDRRSRNRHARAAARRGRRALHRGPAGHARLLAAARRTAEALRTHADGRVWFHTGDVARMDEDGYTTIVQRKKDMIIVDGFNVYPSEVEAVLYSHPAVRLAAVIGVPDAYHGEVVKACVVLKDLKDGAAATPADLLAHCRSDLAPYKVPATIDIRTELPMSAVGKILYRVLRDEIS